jgi:DNA segregation ATPase FtsK/SpoIIIE, S-DNA-T family
MSETSKLYAEAVVLVMTTQRASTSYLQRELRISYVAAAEIMGKLEKRGVVSAPNHMGKREVLKGSAP